jgi:hypothetical protein
MGYYSTLHEDIKFHSRIPFEELKAKFEKKDFSGDWKLDRGQDLHPDDAPDTYFLSPAGKEYYGKFYEIEDVARFISEVISEDDYTLIELTGEDNGKYGYLVFHTSLEELEVRQHKVLNDRYNIFEPTWAPKIDGVPIGPFIDMYLRNKKTR